MPSLFAVALKLCQRGVLTVDTIIWLASSLPTDFLGGLGALGGVAMRTTAVMAGGAASLGNALGGTATGFVGDASKTIAQGINHLKPGVVAADITHVLSDGPRIAADHTTSIASLVKNGKTTVMEKTSHLISNEHVISSGHLVPDIAKKAAHTVVDNTSAVTNTAIGATKAAVTENTTKVAHVLDSVNPLHLHIISTGSDSSKFKDAQVQVRVILLSIQSCHGYPEFQAETIFVGKQANSASEPLVCYNTDGDIQVVGTAHAVADVGTRSATKPLGMVGAAKAAATENVAKAANMLESVNPFHVNILSTSKGSKAFHGDVRFLWLRIT